MLEFFPTAQDTDQRNARLRALMLVTTELDSLYFRDHEADDATKLWLLSATVRPLLKEYLYETRINITFGLIDRVDAEAALVAYLHDQSWAARNVYGFITTWESVGSSIKFTLKNHGEYRIRMSDVARLLLQNYRPVDNPAEFMEKIVRRQYAMLCEAKKGNSATAKYRTALDAIFITQAAMRVYDAAVKQEQEAALLSKLRRRRTMSRPITDGVQQPMQQAPVVGRRKDDPKSENDRWFEASKALKRQQEAERTPTRTRKKPARKISKHPALAAPYGKAKRKTVTVRKKSKKRRK